MFKGLLHCFCFYTYVYIYNHIYIYMHDYIYIYVYMYVYTLLKSTFFLGHFERQMIAEATKDRKFGCLT